MKFTFENVGSIKKTTLDLRPLTVILGPNHTHKTYLAYCVHGLIKTFRDHARLRAISSNEENRSTASTEPTAQTLRAVSATAADDFTSRIQEFFQDTHGSLLRDAAFSLEVGKDDAGAHPIKGAPFTLPAERNALVITYKMLSARRYRVLRDQARWARASRESSATRQMYLPGLRAPEDIRYPEPIEDFLDFLTDVELDATRREHDPGSPFEELADRIEEHIQGGHVTRYRGGGLDGRDLAVVVSKSIVLDLYNASSSIKQLAPLLLYLRYRAAPGDTLIIDEPEMNLHPEAQAKLLEALAMLANLGVRVLLTTHSPYFMAHLNNLIAGDQKSPARRKRQAAHLYMQNADAFLSPDDVSAYEMKPDGLSSLFDPEYGIRWDTLSDVSMELQRRHFAIVEEPAKRAKSS